MQNSSSSKTAGIVIVIIIIIAGIWLMTRNSTSNDVAPVAPAAATPVQNTTVDQTATGPAAAITASGNSDASLTQDAASIDAQLKGLSADASAAQQ